MIALLLILVMYGGPTAGLILGWLWLGWKFSLTAAPAAYELANPIPAHELENEIKKIDNELNKKENHLLYHGSAAKWLKFAESGGKQRERRTQIARLSTASPEEAAKTTGRKCLIWGPFAYFLTPQWNTKIEISWYPAEVTANNLVIKTGETLNKAKELESNVRSALDLDDKPKVMREKDYINMSLREFDELKKGLSL